MKPVRTRALAFAAMAASLACTGGGAPPAAPKAARSFSPGEAAVRAAARQIPHRAKMQVQTAWADGDLSAVCAGADCTADPQASPSSFVRIEDTTVVSFLVPRRPTDARVEFARARTDRVVETALLHPGTYMAVEPGLEPGRYVVTLSARWDDREARWLFGLVVPAA